MCVTRGTSNCAQVDDPITTHTLFLLLVHMAGNSAPVISFSKSQESVGVMKPHMDDNT